MIFAARKGALFLVSWSIKPPKLLFQLLQRLTLVSSQAAVELQSLLWLYTLGLSPSLGPTLKFYGSTAGHLKKRYKHRILDAFLSDEYIAFSNLSL